LGQSGEWGRGGFSRTISTGWPRTENLPVSASQVARITGVSHQSPANRDKVCMVYMCTAPGDTNTEKCLEAISSVLTQTEMV
jgi:hypothetical protein